MALPISFFGMTFVDYSKEKSSLQFPITALSAGNVAAQQGLLATLEAAIVALSLGVEVQSNLVFARTLVGATPPADAGAQRELKFIVRYHDATTYQKFRIEIPCADPAATITNSDEVDIATGAAATFVAAFEAVVKSPANSSNAVVVDGIQLVGRNL